MITILYVPCYQYVSSIHPLVYSYLENCEIENLQVINLNQVKNIDQLIEQSSLLIFDYSIIEAMRISIKGQKEFKSYIYFPNTEGTEFYKICIEKILKNSKRKIFWASMNDAQNLFENIDQLELIGITRAEFLNKMEGIIWFTNSENLIKNNNNTKQYATGYEIICKKINDTADFVAKHFEYEFEIPHCVTIKKNYKQGIKKWDFYVPGVSYPTRKIALHSATHLKLKNANSKFITFLKNKYNGIIQRIYFINPEKVYTMNQNVMNFIIRHSKFTFVCGGPPNYFVRKFLEVPLQASVMVGYGPDNLADYGFIDAENYINAEPELFGDVVNTFVNNKTYQEKLTIAAYTAVSVLHSVEARSEQLVSSLIEINKGVVKKGKFIGGQYSFLDQNKNIIKIQEAVS